MPPSPRTIPSSESGGGGREPPTELSRVLFAFLKVFICIAWLLLDKKSHPTTAHGDGDGDGLPRALPSRGRAAACGHTRGPGLGCGDGRDAPAARGLSSQLRLGPTGALEDRSCGVSWRLRLRSPSPRPLRDSPSSAPDKGAARTPGAGRATPCSSPFRNPPASPSRLLVTDSEVLIKTLEETCDSPLKAVRGADASN